MKKLLFPLFAISILLVSCNNYNKISYSKTTVFKNKSDAEKIDENDALGYQDEKSNTVIEPVVSEEVRTGIPTEVDIEESAETEKLSDDLSRVSENSEVDLTHEQTQRTIDHKVSKVSLFRSAKEASLGGKIVLILVLGTALLIICVIAYAFNSF